MKQGIPIRISPFFWITSGIIGWLSSQSLIGTFIWIGIIFVSVLVHEFGHALSAKLFGQSPRIELVAFGGLTYPEGPKLSLWKEFIVVLCGPAFGFGLFFLSSLLLGVASIANSGLAAPLNAFRIVNLFWSVINLLPVLPLDGGQLLRIIFQSFLGVKGIRVAIVISLILAISFAIVFFFLNRFLIGTFFFLFAFENIQSFKASKLFSSSDQNEAIQEEMMQAEEALLSGHDEKAEKQLETIRQKTKEGMIFIAATQDLAAIKFKKRDIEATYKLLKEIEENIAPEFLSLLHLAAFEMRDFNLVTKLSLHCYQQDASLEVALRNAIAFASNHDVKACIGWLETATRSGLENLLQIIEEKAFDTIRNEPDFVKFIDTQKKITPEG